MRRVRRGVSWKRVRCAPALVKRDGNMREAKTSKKRDEAVGRLEGPWDELRAMSRVMSRGDKEFFDVSRRINDTNDPSTIPDRRLLLGCLDANDLCTARALNEGLEQSLCNHIRSTFA